MLRRALPLHSCKRAPRCAASRASSRPALLPPFSCPESSASEWFCDHFMHSDLIVASRCCSCSSRRLRPRVSLFTTLHKLFEWW